MREPARWASVAEREQSNTIRDLVRILWEPFRNQGAEFTAEGFNLGIKFRRTKTLMEGDDCCDHRYTVEK